MVQSFYLKTLHLGSFLLHDDLIRLEQMLSGEQNIIGQALKCFSVFDWKNCIQKRFSLH